MEKLLITGGSGFIGRSLIRLLKGKYDIYLISSQKDLSMSDFSGHIIFGDLLDPIQLEKTLYSIKPDKLIHLAWAMEPGNYDLPTNFSWLIASMRLLEMFQKFGGNSVMIAGSCAQYDWTLGGCDESRTPRSNSSTYGTCKNVLEDFALSFCASHDIHCILARPFFIYGPYENEHRFVAYLVNYLLKNKEATVQNGAIYRDFLYVEDVASLMMALFEENQSGVFNIGSGEMINLGELALILGTLLDKRNLLTIKMPKNVKDKYVFANMKKVRKVTDWQPEYNFETGLLKTIDWWKKNG